MTDFATSLMQKIPLDTEALYAVTGVLAAVLVLALLFRKQLLDWREERQVRRMIRRLGVRRLRNLQLPDGTGGEVIIDYLLLTGDALLVVGVKRFTGLIFGSPQTRQWTQVINRVSYKFPNPDEYLQRQVNAIHQLAPGVPVAGLHLFTHGAVFPKDKPDNVLSTREIRKMPKRPRPGDIPDVLRLGWEQLLESLRG